jgi:hypothetical protein
LVFLNHHKIVILSEAPGEFYEVIQRLAGAQSKDPEGANTSTVFDTFSGTKAGARVLEVEKVRELWAGY